MTDGQNGRDKRMEKLQVMVADSEIKAIDDWRFENRAASRSAAIRTLLFLGMAFWQNAPEDAEALLKELSVD